MLETQTQRGKRRSPHLFLTCCVSFRRLTARCRRDTERSRPLSPERAQPPPGGSCRSTATPLHFPSVVPPERPQTSSADTFSRADIQRTDQHPRVQTTSRLPLAAPEVSSHGNVSPEVFLRTVKVRRRRGRTLQMERG